jgi:hypothetical protein
VTPADRAAILARMRADRLARNGVPITNTRGEVVGHAGRGVAPEDDWRPLPSCAEVLAHANRTGCTFAPWLFVLWPTAGHGCARLVRLAAGGDAVIPEPGASWDCLDNPVARWRPITLLGGALPWPEVPR